MHHLTYGISLATTYYDRASCTLPGQLVISQCTSLAPRPMTVIFGLETRLRVRMRTTFENGVLHNGQQPGTAENSFIDQGELVAMKMLSGHKPPRCDKDQFCDKMTVST